MDPYWSYNKIPKEISYLTDKLHEKIDLVDTEFKYYYNNKYKDTLDELDNLYVEIDVLKSVMRYMFFVMLFLVMSNIYLLFR